MRVVIVIPPFAGLDRPALGPHILQACASTRWHDVQVLYANVTFAAAVGMRVYNDICYGPTTGLAGERVFAHLAFGLQKLGYMDAYDESYFKRRPSEKAAKVTYEQLSTVADVAGQWIDEIVDAILSRDPEIVGCSTTFEQTLASIALLSRLKAKRPELTTLLGGSNCEGEMAHGLATATDAVDYFFSGECEAVFPSFLDSMAMGKRPIERVISGTPCQNMDSIPTPDFSEFYEQLDNHLPEWSSSANAAIWLPYESSRGCWWGQKQHCTFCGINGETMSFREKSARRVLSELDTLLATHPSRSICMVDNIMPFRYFRDLLPELGRSFADLHIFYEQKANLSFERVVVLRKAGVAVIQPGIEALSSGLLQLMKKGVTARQNVALLRFARGADLAVNWNLLYGFPGDSIEDYQRTLELLPMLSHLHPPSGLYHLSIDRFSPYHSAPAAFGIENVRPMASYYSVFPAGSEHSKIAYHFVGDYNSASIENSSVMHEIRAGIERWRLRWQDGPEPALSVAKIDEDQFLLIDTRELDGTRQFRMLNREQTMLILLGPDGNSAASDDYEWAIAGKLLASVDSRWIPLAVCDYELYVELESTLRHPELKRDLVSTAVVFS